MTSKKCIQPAQTGSGKEDKMSNKLNIVLEKIGEDYQNILQADGRNYVEINISQKAAELGFKDIEECYRDVFAIVPIGGPVEGMKVRIDGRTFVNYDQFDSGIAVPNYVSRNADLNRKPYTAQNSMICNFN